LSLLDHMNRALTQTRALMNNHGWLDRHGPLPSVSVLLVTRRPDFVNQIVEQMAAQSYADLEIVLACHGFEPPNVAQWDPAVADRVGAVLHVPATTPFGEVLAQASTAASGQLLSKVDDDDLYGVDHITDVVTAWLYSSAQLVGRKLTLIRDVERDELVVRRLFHESYRSKVAGGSTTIAKADLAAIGGWRPQSRGVDRGLWTRLQDAGAHHYACSGPGYVHQRHPHEHTWAVGMDLFQDDYYDSTISGLPPAALGVLDDETLARYAQGERWNDSALPTVG